jgi:ribosomal protein S18 acetylase RimI-like enzyme
MIREASLADAHAIAVVQVRSWQHAYRDLMPADFLAGLSSSLPHRENRWAEMLQAETSHVFVACVEGVIVGWISVGACRDADAGDDAAGEIMAIYLLPEHCAIGLGWPLWQTGVQRLIDLGHSRMSLWVLAGNTRAIRFYRRAGLLEEAGSRRSVSIGGRPLEEVRYVGPIVEA